MVNGIRAFLPGSLVDMRPVKDTIAVRRQGSSSSRSSSSTASATTWWCRAARCSKRRQGAEREKLLDDLQEGAVVKGIVKNITDYGAFVDLGGIDGLLHITDLAWRRVKHPSEVLTVGDEVTAKVLKFDQEKNRVSLGLKQLGEDPWVGLVAPLSARARACSARSPTSPTTARSSRSRRASRAWCTSPRWTGPTRTSIPSKVVQLGDEVEVMILEIDEERRRISLGMKQCMPNPWDEFAMNHKKGDKVKGQIKSITDFGVFIGLPGGIDGLVHLSDLSWTLPGEEAVRDYKKGDEVEAVVLAIDVERERISLGIKQLEGDPFTNFVADARQGQRRQGHGQVDRRQGRGDRARRRRRRLPARLRSLARPRRGHPHAPEGRRRGQRDDHQRRPQEPHDQPVDQGEGSRRGDARRCRSMTGGHGGASTGTTNLGALLQGQAGRQARPTNKREPRR